MSSPLPGQYPLYFVTDAHLNAGRSKLEVIAAALRGGVKLVQFRDKSLEEEAFEAEARMALDLCRRHEATLIVNDRAEVAARIGAHGVHLGQGDMPPETARKILGPEAIIGLSTHDEKEVRGAQGLPLTYINIGPMFPTGTKEHAKALGVDEVLRLAALNSFPWSTMGGIKREHLPGLFSRGIRCAAMVTEISLADNVEQQVACILSDIAAVSNPLQEFR